MKWTIGILFVLFSMFSFAQSQEYIRTGNHYFKYSECWFESSFKSTDRAISAYCDTIKYAYNFLSSYFNIDSTYHISLTLFQKSDSAVYEQTYYFHGKYKIHDNDIHLLGEHPFDSDIITVKERKHKEYTTIMGFKFRLNNPFNATCRKKHWTYCDGNSEIDKHYD